MRLARGAGLSASREWQNAQASDPTERVRDIRIGPDFYQVQVSRDGFERIYRELAGVRGFIFRRDRDGWLVAIRLQDYLELIAGTPQWAKGMNSRRDWGDRHPRET